MSLMQMILYALLGVVGVVFMWKFLHANEDKIIGSGANTPPTPGSVPVAPSRGPILTAMDAATALLWGPPAPVAPATAPTAAAPKKMPGWMKFVFVLVLGIGAASFFMYPNETRLFFNQPFGVGSSNFAWAFLIFPAALFAAYYFSGKKRGWKTATVVVLIIFVSGWYWLDLKDNGFNRFSSFGASTSSAPAGLQRQSMATLSTPAFVPECNENNTVTLKPGQMVRNDKKCDMAFLPLANPDGSDSEGVVQYVKGNKKTWKPATPACEGSTCDPVNGPFIFQTSGTNAFTFTYITCPQGKWIPGTWNCRS